MAVLVGKRVCWGCGDAHKRIMNLPPNAIKVRVKWRNNAVAKAFVRTTNGLECWILAPCLGGVRLAYLMSANHSK